MRRQLQDQRQWHTVFAWFPITTKDGQRVWLERVERRYKFSSWFDDYFEFRLPASADTHAKRGDAAQTAAPSPMSGAVASAQPTTDAQPIAQPPPSNEPEHD